MKKQFLLLAGSAVLFASCGSNNNPAQTQAQIDSTVNAKLAQHDADNAHKNDSIINAEAKLKAEAEHRNHEHADKKDEGNNNQNNATSTQAPAPAAAPAPQQTAQDAKFNNRQPANQNTQGNKLTTDQQKAQDDKFNRR